MIEWCQMETSPVLINQIYFRQICRWPDNKIIQQYVEEGFDLASYLVSNRFKSSRWILCKMQTIQWIHLINIYFSINISPQSNYNVVRNSFLSIHTRRTLKVLDGICGAESRKIHESKNSSEWWILHYKACMSESWKGPKGHKWPLKMEWKFYKGQL